MTLPLNCLRRNEPLANRTSFRIGGPAEYFAEPSSLDELVGLLREAYREGIPVSVVGGGTNTLAADRGIRGLVIHLGKAFRTIQTISQPEESTALVACGAALLTQRLVGLAASEGWGDLDGLAGLPGQIGGAVVMNAQDIGRFVERIRLVSPSGELRELSQRQLRFSYRYSQLPPGILTEVMLRFPKIPPQEAASRIRQAFTCRNTTQELRLPSAGCAFRNPSAGPSAGRLIDQAGLKGARIGDAQVSWRHANFIVNLGQASCGDVLALMEYIQRQVGRQFHTLLEPEVRIMGQALSQ